MLTTFICAQEMRGKGGTAPFMLKVQFIPRKMKLKTERKSAEIADSLGKKMWSLDKQVSNPSTILHVKVYLKDFQQ